MNLPVESNLESDLVLTILEDVPLSEILENDKFNIRKVIKIGPNQYQIFLKDLVTILTNYKVDPKLFANMSVALQPNDVWRKNKRLIVFDMDVKQILIIVYTNSARMH
jgi:hypothetical protein